MAERGGFYRRLGLVTLVALTLAFAMYSARFSLDFEIYYNAGQRILAGNPDVYPHDRPAPGSTDPFHVYRYPPVAAVLFAPLALLPLEVSAFLFALVKLAGLFSIVTMVLRLTGKGLENRGKILALSLLGIGGYFVEEFRNGNIQLLLLWMIVAATYLAERSKNAVPGFLLALGACFKLTPLIYVPYFFMRRRWLLCGAAIASVVLLFLLPSLIFGADTGAEMLDTFIEITVQKTVDPHNYSLRGAILKYLTPLDVEDPKYGKINFVSMSEASATSLWLCLVAVVGLVLVVSTRGPIRDLLARSGLGAKIEDDIGREAAAASGNAGAGGNTGASENADVGGNTNETGSSGTGAGRIDGPTRTLLEVSLWTTALLLASPHTQRLWFTSLFLPFAVMLAMIVDAPDDPRRRWIQAAVGVSFVVASLLPPLLPGRAMALAYEVRSPYLFATMFVFAVLTWLLWTGTAARPQPGRGNQ